MRAGSVVLGILAVLCSFAATESRAAEPPGVDKIVALNKSAVAAFSAGEHEKAKTQLMEAVVLGKENGLGMHAAMARTYLHLGVVHVDGLKDKDKGQRYFAMAQKVRPDIELTPSLATASVKAAFEAARGDSGAPAKVEAPKPAAAAPPPPPQAEPKETKAEARAREKAAKSAAAAEAKAADKAARIIEDSRTAKFEEKIATLEGQLKKASEESQKREGELRAEKQKLQKELAQAREAEKQLRAENTRLQTEERKLQVQLADKDKQLAQKDGQVADAKADAKRERENREKVEKLDQEKVRLIAEAAEREKKQREAAEKLEREKLQAEAREKEKRAQQEKERAAREKLAEGPDLPAQIPQPLYCGNPDEAQLGAELHIHCVPQGQVKARSLVLYYRTAGNAHFDAATMSRNKKGWFAAAIPANRVTGKSLQYYVEARGAKDEVAAANGKAASPNILALRSAEQLAKKPAGSSDPLAAAVSGKAAGKAKATKTSAKAARTTAAKRTKARK